MTDHPADKDITRVRPPSTSVRKIPERYDASIVIISGTTIQFILQDTGEGRMYEIAE